MKFHLLCSVLATGLAAATPKLRKSGALLERQLEVAQSTAAPPDAQLWNARAGLACVAWRKTLTCTPSGPRDALQDKDCGTLVESEESGFCECEGYVHTAAVPCGHEPVNCTKECSSLQELHREVFGADYSSGGQGSGGASAMGMGGGYSQDLHDMDEAKDPYAAALKYGKEAQMNVDHAVQTSNTLLTSARDMISKMMSLKPWAKISEYGKQAEEAGKKTQELAKLARPFIYEQVNASASRQRHYNL